MKKLLIIPFLLFGLVACQQQEQGEEVDKQENVTEEEQFENEVEEETEIDLSLYDKVIDDYARFSGLDPGEVEAFSSEFVKSGAYDYFNTWKLYEGISVTHYDLTDNGVEELIVSLRIDDEAYILIDLYTIVDGELFSLFTDELSDDVQHIRSTYFLLDNGKLVNTAIVGQGEEAGIIYEIDEEKMEYVESYKGFTEDGDFDVIEEALEDKISFADLPWEAIEAERKLTVHQQFLAGDFSELMGVWENESGQVTISEDKIEFSSGGSMDIRFNADNSGGESAVFLGLMSEDGIGGAGLIFFPAGYEIILMEDGEPVPSNVNEHKFYIGQDAFATEDEIFYKVSD